MYNDAKQLVPTFPNARYLIRDSELAHQVGSGTYDTFFAPLEKAGQLETIPSSVASFRLTDDVELQSGYEGHTPGLQVTRIASKGHCAYFIGDALHVLLQFSFPHYSPSFDWDSEKSVIARTKLLDTIHAEGALLMSPHLPFPGIGHVGWTNNRRTFVPLELPPSYGSL
jgi:glyoxylase-like metal-dependent hydrolase (beta-lactamase superfamily II)